MATTQPKTKDVVHTRTDGSKVSLKTFLNEMNTDAFSPNNQGPGSGLNADLLDGQHLSYYLNASNVTRGTLPRQLVTKFGISDLRAIALNPNQFGSEWRADIKTHATINLTYTTSDNLASVLTFNPGNDDTNGPVSQFALTSDSSIFFRQGTRASGWGAWHRVWTEADIDLPDSSYINDLPIFNLNLTNRKTLPSWLVCTRNSQATYFDKTGARKTAAVNEPVWEWDPVTLRCLGLRKEPGTTNLLLNTASLSTQTVSLSAGVHTISFYGTGSITLSGVATGVVSSAGAYPARKSLRFNVAANGNLTVTVTGQVLEAQLERGELTSYIPSTAANGVRAADAISGTSPVALGTQFTFYTSQQFMGSMIAASETPVNGITVSNSGTNSYVSHRALARASNPGADCVLAETGTVFVDSAGLFQIDFRKPVRQATSVKAGKQVACINGATPEEFTINKTVASANTINLCSQTPHGTTYIRHIAVWSLAYDSASLKALTE